MKFNSLDELNNTFTTGKMRELPKDISVKGVKYTLFQSPKYNMLEMASGKKPMVVYNLDHSKENLSLYDKFHTDADDPTSFQDRLVFVWSLLRLHLRPVVAKFVPKSRMGQVMVKEATNDENKLTVHKDKIIGDVADVVLINFNNGKAIRGKVDTGAELSSLHADDVEIVGDSSNRIVKFVFGGKRYKMTLQDTQAVQTADNGIENRPVVKFNIKINGSILNDVLMNLNDRSNMPDKLLIGQNILEKGKFLIDPQINEGIDWEMLQEEFANIEIADNVEMNTKSNAVNEALEELFQALKHCY